jgi:O-antigen/teichoic acid export membrane protein
MRRSPNEAWPDPRAYAGAPRTSAQRGRPGSAPVRAPNGRPVTAGPAPVRSQPPRPGGPADRQKGKGGQPQLAEVARGGTLNLIGAGANAATTVGVTVFVTREFSKAIAGAFFTATSAFLIVEAVASLGANVGLVYFIARLRSLGEEKRIPAILRAAVIPVIIASLMLTAAMVGTAGPLAKILLSGHLAKSGAVSAPAVAQSLRALALTLPFAALLDTYLGVGRGYRDMRPTVVIDKIIRSGAQLIGIIIAVAAGSAAFLAPLWALPYVPAAAVAWLWIRRIRRRPSKGPRGMPDVPPELAALLALSTPVPKIKGALRGSRTAQRRLANANPRGFWAFTTPRGIASLASITLQRIDIVLVAILLGPVQAAVYTAATRFLVAGQLGNMAISMAAQPRFTELFALGDRRSANVIYQVTTAWLVLLTWPLYMLAIVYGPEVLSVFGHSYKAGAAVMLILGLTMLLATACGQVDMVLITTGRSSWSLVNGLLAVGVNVSLDLVLIPRYGITGAAIGWAIAIMVTNLMPMAQLASSIHLQPFGRGTLLAAGLSAFAFGAVPFAIRTVLGGGLTGLAAGVAAGCLVQALGLWRFNGVLRLSAMPGVSSIQARLHRAINR